MFCGYVVDMAESVRADLEVTINVRLRDVEEARRRDCQYQSVGWRKKDSWY